MTSPDGIAIKSLRFIAEEIIYGVVPRGHCMAGRIQPMLPRIEAEGIALVHRIIGCVTERLPRLIDKRVNRDELLRRRVVVAINHAGQWD